MTNYVHNTDILLSLWALEQQRPTASHPTSQTCLFSGGQDSSTLAWLIYHTDATAPQLLHCNHLWQDDNFFMTEHALRLSFWVGWGYTVAFPPHQVGTEQDASVWRRAITGQLGAYHRTQTSCNGHTASDHYESAFFHFVRTSASGMGAMRTTEQQRQSAATTSSSTDTIFGRVYTQGVNINKGRETQLALDVRLGIPSRRGHVQLTRLRGLCSRPASRLWRPLAALTRAETRLLTTMAQLPVYPDQTNLELHTTRTQVRALILPLLAQLGFSPPG